MSEAPLRHALREQAVACESLGSPFMGRLLRLLADGLRDDTPLGARLLGWTGDLGPRGQSVPLRLAGALHALRLNGDAGLAAVYPPREASDAALWRAVADAMGREAAFIESFIDNAPQTNEVRRAAVLIAVGHMLAGWTGRPMVVSELGASAGLNLNWDRFALETPTGTLGPADPALTLRPDWLGDAVGGQRPVVTDRRGVDINPLSPEGDALRLTAYLWPDQPERLTLTRAAMAVAGPAVDRQGAGDWLEARLAATPADHLHLVYTTIAWQYFPPALQSRITTMMEGAGAGRATPLAWFAMEADERSPGAGLSLRLWPGDHRLNLGRVDFHGRWVRWITPPNPLA